MREVNARLEAISNKPIAAAPSSLAQGPAPGEIAQLADEIRDMHAKLDGRAADAESVEPLLRSLEARLGGLDTQADANQALAEAVARLGERIDGAPSSADLSALERLVEQLGEKIDGQASIALDIHAMQRRQAEAPPPDPHAATAAALDELWARIDERLSSQAQQPLAREITGLHDRLDAIDATLRPRAQFEHVLHELTAQGDDTRQALQILLARDADRPGLERKLADLGAQHSQADRATQERLQRVSEALLKLIERIDRLDAEPNAPPAPLDAAPAASAASGWTGGAEPAFEPPSPADPEEKPAAILRRQTPPAREAAAPLLTIPPAAAGAERGLARSSLPDHIAAARRAAQAAMAETADKTAAKAAVAQAAKASRAGKSEPVADRIEGARQFFAERRRPLLLGLGLVALLTMVAFVGLRSRLGSHEKSEIDAPKPAVVGNLSTPIPSPIPSLAATPAGGCALALAGLRHHADRFDPAAICGDPLHHSAGDGAAAAGRPDQGRPLRGV